METNNSSNVATVQQFTPDQADAASSGNAALGNTINAAGLFTAQNEPNGNQADTQEQVSQARHPKVQELIAAFNDAIANSDFTDDLKKLDKAIDALKLPDPEERVKAQLRINAKKKLSLQAANEYQKTGVFIPPAPEKIEQHIKEGLEKWRAKQAK